MASPRDVTIVVRAVDKTKAGFASVRNGLKGIRGGIAAVGVTAAVGLFGVLSRKSGEAAERLLFLSKRFDQTAESVRRLEVTTRTFGVNAQEFSALYQRLIRRIEEALEGNKKLVDTFRELGVERDALATKTPEQIFLDLADGFANATDKGAALQNVIAILDVEGGKLAAAFAEGRQGLTETARRVDRLGIALQDSTIEKAAAAQTEVELLKATLESAGIIAASKVAPAFEAVARAINDMTEATVAQARAAPFAENIEAQTDRIAELKEEAIALRTRLAELNQQRFDPALPEELRLQLADAILETSEDFRDTARELRDAVQAFERVKTDLNASVGTDPTSRPTDFSQPVSEAQPTRLISGNGVFMTADVVDKLTTATQDTASGINIIVNQGIRVTAGP